MTRRTTASRPRGFFITGTDTGVGKTQVSTALAALLHDAGVPVAPFKPYETGCEDLRKPQDALSLKAAAGARDPIDRICPHRFRLPLAPGVAAERLGREPSFEKTLAAFRAFGDRPVIAEGAGGLYVPIDSKRDIIDLIAALKLPVVLVARLGLGTLNHTALSLEALAARKLKVAAVVMSEGVRSDDPSIEDNASLIARRHGVRVLGPVRFETDPERRREAFRRALEPLAKELISQR